MIGHRWRRYPSRVHMLCVLVSSMLLAGCATSGSTSSQADDDAADAYTQLGVAYLERDNLTRAFSALDRALEINPRNAEALQALALVYQQQSENELANHYFQQAINTAPSLTRARNNYAAFLYQQGQFNAACEQLEIASHDAQYANRAQLFTNLGQCYLAADNIDEARKRLLRAVSIDPRSPRGYLLLAELEVSQGNDGQAWEPLQRYLQLAGQDPVALEMAIDIAHARGDHAAAANYQRLLNID